MSLDKVKSQSKVKLKPNGILLQELSPRGGHLNLFCFLFACMHLTSTACWFRVAQTGKHLDAYVCIPSVNQYLVPGIEEIQVIAYATNKPKYHFFQPGDIYNWTLRFSRLM